MLLEILFKLILHLSAVRYLFQELLLSEVTSSQWNFFHSITILVEILRVQLWSKHLRIRIVDRGQVARAIRIHGVARGVDD